MSKLKKASVAKCSTMPLIYVCDLLRSLSLFTFILIQYSMYGHIYVNEQQLLYVRTYVGMVTDWAEAQQLVSGLLLIHRHMTADAPIKLSIYSCY